MSEIRSFEYLDRNTSMLSKKNGVTSEHFPLPVWKQISSLGFSGSLCSTSTVRMDRRLSVVVITENFSRLFDDMTEKEEETFLLLQQCVRTRSFYTVL